MTSFLSDFLSYFMPDLVLPAWAELFTGIICLTLFFKVLISAIGVFGNGRY